jgi:hypothetical protein
MSPLFRVERLDPSKHRREQFNCESEPLTRFIRERARKEAAAKASACFVIVPYEDPTRIAGGYYTLAAASVSLSKLPERLTKSQPRYSELPVTLLGRLARDLSFKGGGIGALLMISVFTRVCSSSSEIGSIALVTDPKDEKARRFYQTFDFETLDERRMILSMTDVCARASR